MRPIYFLFTIMTSLRVYEGGGQESMTELKEEIQKWWDNLPNNKYGAIVHACFEHPLARFVLMFLYAPVQNWYWRYTRHLNDTRLMDSYKRYEQPMAVDMYQNLVIDED